MSNALSRRQLFRVKLKDLRTLVKRPDLAPIRPPGALDEDAFAQTCERCHACAEACPHDVIHWLGPSAGHLEGTPVLNPETVPCHWCEGLPCTAACPSEALSQDSVRPIGKVQLNLDECLNSHGILCDTCSLICPDNSKAIKMINRTPVLDEDQCVGCGLCRYHCESDGQPLTFLPQSY